MPARIRLQRRGKKGYPYYHIVIADSRAPRDGKFIEKIGTYNPNTNPATIDFNMDKALDWIQKGAQPTDSVRAMLSYRGVLYKNHLIKGVNKGALTMEQADAKFQKWLEEKEGRIQGKRESLSKSAEDRKREQLKAEAEKKEARAKAIAAKNTPPAEEAPAEEAAPEATETPAAEAAAETPEATTEAPEAKTEEAPAEGSDNAETPAENKE